MFKIKHIPLACLSACPFLLQPGIVQGGGGADNTPKAAVFVRSVATNELQPYADAFLQQLRSRVDGRGFSLLDRADITDALQRAPEGTHLGALLAEQSSALRLAQLLGADYLLIANLVGLSEETREFEGAEIKTTNRTYTLRASYTMADASAGGGITGNAFAVSQTQRQTPGLKVFDSGVIDTLLERAAEEMAHALIEDRAAGKITEAPEKAGPVIFTVSARLQDIALPDVTLDADGRAQISAETFPVRATGVTVELDGITLGSTPGQYQAMPGHHTMRLSREGFEPWERNVNLYEGFNLEAALEFTPEGLRRWKETSAFLQALKDDARLTDAEVEVLKGKARQLEQSGFRVDTREAPRIDIYNRIWNPYPQPLN